MYNLVSVVQCHEFIEGEIIAPPNLPDKSTTANPPKLLDQVPNKLRVKHYSIRIEQAYSGWIKRFIYFHGKRHPKDCGEQTIRDEPDREDGWVLESAHFYKELEGRGRCTFVL